MSLEHKYMNCRRRRGRSDLNTRNEGIENISRITATETIQVASLLASYGFTRFELFFQNDVV